MAEAARTRDDGEPAAVQIVFEGLKVAGGSKYTLRACSTVGNPVRIGDEVEFTVRATCVGVRHEGDPITRHNIFEALEIEARGLES